MIVVQCYPCNRLLYVQEGDRCRHIDNDVVLAMLELNEEGNGGTQWECGVVVCSHCHNEELSLYPDGTKRLECPKCGRFFETPRLYAL